MKKSLFTLGLILGLLVFSCNISFANDSEKFKLIYEIGTLSNQEKFDDALEKCSKAIKTYPDDAELYYWSATIKSLKGDKKNALIDYNKVIELNPKDENAYVMRGICKSDLGDTNGAIEDYNSALKINPQNSSAYSMRACAKIDLGDLNGANLDLNLANKIVDDITKSSVQEVNIKQNKDSEDKSISPKSELTEKIENQTIEHQ